MAEPITTTDEKTNQLIKELKEKSDTHIADMEAIGCHPVTIEVEKELLNLLSAVVVAAGMPDDIKLVDNDSSSHLDTAE